MKFRTLAEITLPLLFSFHFASCDSSSYEIEEVEVYEDTSKTTARTEIKEEIEQPKIEPKEYIPEPLKSPPSKFTIQIGAFEKESNASDYMIRAKNRLNYDFNYKLVNGLYKIRTDLISSQEEAISILMKIRDAGYFDAFILESDKE